MSLNQPENQEISTPEELTDLLVRAFSSIPSQDPYQISKYLANRPSPNRILNLDFHLEIPMFHYFDDKAQKVPFFNDGRNVDPWDQIRFTYSSVIGPMGMYLTPSPVALTVAERLLGLNYEAQTNMNLDAFKSKFRDMAEVGVILYRHHKIT